HVFRREPADAARPEPLALQASAARLSVHSACPGSSDGFTSPLSARGGPVAARKKIIHVFHGSRHRLDPNRAASRSNAHGRLQRLYALWSAERTAHLDFPEPA